MANKESTVRTLTVAVLVCLVCSVFVAGGAVALKPIQAENRQLDKQRSILAIAGLGEAGMSAKQVKALFAERIQARVVDLDKGVFSDLPNPFIATRYHSLAVEQASLPDCLEVTAWTDDGEIMGLQHRTRPIHGVQFHPESIATEGGHKLLGNFLELAARARV